MSPLLFSYDNAGPDPYRFLMIFAVDGTGHVGWYFPDGDHGGATSIAVEAGLGRELSESVRLGLKPGPVELYGLFSRTPLTVAVVERAARGGVGPDRESGRLPVAQTGQHHLHLLVQDAR